MKTNVPLTLLALEACAVSAAQVVPLSFTKTKRDTSLEQKIQRRSSTISATLNNAELLYTINVTVGTPPQKLTLQVDTGSSDVWMPASSVNCQNTADGCQGGTFKQQDSSTFKVVDPNAFNITYVDGTGSTGDYFTDEYSFGGITVKNLQMGLATNTTVGTGIMGIAYANGEAVCHSYPCTDSYPSVVQDLVSQGFIQSKSYSLWLDDLNSTTGQLLFGGVDTAKYKGDLVALPIQPDSQTGGITSFTVAWTNLTVTAKGQTQALVPPGFSSPAIFDSGTSVTVLPNQIALNILNQLRAEYSKEFQGYIGDCAVGNTQATLDYTFGSSNGPTIHVPIRELYEPATDNNGNQIYSHGKPVCQLGISPADGDPVLFGDTFLRSAYVVYDLDNNQIGLASTNFNPSGSNIVEIGKGGIPGIASTASGVQVDQSMTGQVGPQTSIASGFSAVSSIMAGSTATGLLASVATETSTTSHKSSASTSVHVPDFTGILTAGAAIMMAAFGSSLLFL